MHPIDRLLESIHVMDFAVLSHSLASHGRDYVVIVQNCIGGDRGTFEVIFTHCVQLDYETRVRDDVWPISWTDEFTDYGRWEAAGEPDGYVWGCNWSNAYPGLIAVDPSSVAHDWSERLGKSMYEATVETDRFFLRLIFHSISIRKPSDDAGVISQVIFPTR